jgi:monofunctional biosynthetic peptidoglycan transglycosylase
MRSLAPHPDEEPVEHRGRRGAARVIRVTVWILAALAGAATTPVLVLRWMNPPTSAFMVERRIAGLVKPVRRFDISYEWKDWDAIAASAKLAVVAAEDQRFPEHGGFDFESMKRAVSEQDRRGRLRGASTISQQVAKNLFLWSGRSYLRKGLEAGFTVLIETLWPKRRILEVYLNVVEFGDGAYGVGAASRRYFGKPPSRLTAPEAALLASVLPNPRRFRVDRPSPYVQRRALWVEAQMARLGPGYLEGL